MKRIITLAILSLFFSEISIAQNVGIGTSTPNSSAKFDISSTNSGLLIPRVALTMTTAAGPITAPATSLMVYNTATVADVTPGYYYWDGVKWMRFASGASTAWDILGNNGITAANFIGTINAADLIMRTTNAEKMRITAAGNVGIGITAPTNKVDIAQTARSGTHGTGLPFYVTGNVGAGSAGAVGFEFRHDNGTQGIGLGYNTIYATGSNAAQDLGFASRSTGNLNFTTNAAQRMIILGSNGNVGMGLVNPTYGLELNGTFGFGNGTAGAYRSRTETRDNAGLSATQSGMFETSAPTNYPAGASSWWHLLDVRHSNNANNYAMQIAGSFFDQDLYFRKTNNNGAQAWSKLLTSTSGWATTGNAGTVAGTNFIGTTDGVDFVTKTSNIERMRVTAAGNVGVGTAGPGYLLDVNGTIRAIDLYAAGGQNIILGDDTYFSDVDLASTAGLYSTSSTSAALSLGNISNDPGMVLGGTANFYHGTGQQIMGNGGRYSMVASLGVSGNTTYESGGFFADGNTAAIWSPGDGNQGQPAALLYFMDEDFFDGGNTNPYDNTALKSYINTAGALVTVSDERKKNSIVPIKNVLNRINQINGYEYFFNLAPEEIQKGQKASLQSGVLAQEIIKQFPTVVEQSEQGDMFVNYSAITPYLISGIKEQQVIIENQKRISEQQEVRIETLEDELEELKNLVKTLIETKK